MSNAVSGCAFGVWNRKLILAGFGVLIAVVLAMTTMTLSSTVAASERLSRYKDESNQTMVLVREDTASLKVGMKEMDRRLARIELQLDKLANGR